MADAPATPFTCLNCGTLHAGNYCPSCGQKHGPPMPTTGEIVGDLMRSALSPSGKVFETLWTLLRRPGELTRAFNSGQRMRYVHPVRVYLLCVFLFVAAITVNNTVRSWLNQPPFGTEITSLFSRTGSAQGDAAKPPGDGATVPPSAAHEMGRTVGGMLPGWVREHVKARAAGKSAMDSAQYQQRASAAMSRQFSALFAVLVPFMALLNWGLYAGRGITYAGHFVYMLHVTAAGCLFLLPVYALNLPLLYVPATLAAMSWSVLAARRAFSVSLWGSVWRYALYLIPSMLIATLAGAVVGVVSVLMVD